MWVVGVFERAGNVGEFQPNIVVFCHILSRYGMTCERVEKYGSIVHFRARFSRVGEMSIVVRSMDGRWISVSSWYLRDTDRYILRAPIYDIFYLNTESNLFVNS